MKTFRCNVCENVCTITINDNNRRPPRGCITGQEYGATWIETQNTDADRSMVMVERAHRENELLKHELQKINSERVYYEDRFIRLKMWINNLLELGTSGLEAVWNEKKEEK